MEITLRKKELNYLEAENSFFHFTDFDNLESIQSNGLLPNIGKNSKGIEKRAKIFFAKGINGTLEICNVWIRWFIYKKKRQEYLSQVSSPNEEIDMTSRFYKDFSSGRFFDIQTKREAYQEFFHFMQRNCFLTLDLVEGEDFNPNDVDEAKQIWLNRNEPQMLKALYGNIDTDNDPTSMERWNMHTIPEKMIPPYKIGILKHKGMANALNLLPFLRLKATDPNLDIELLDDFLQEYNLMQSTQKVQ